MKQVLSSALLCGLQLVGELAMAEDESQNPIQKAGSDMLDKSLVAIGCRENPFTQ